MSTATPFLFRGGLPYCASQALPPGGSSFDYVELADTDGDEGFAEALRLFWLLERVTFVPSGTATATGPSAPPLIRTYTATFSFPDLDPTGIDFAAISDSAMAVAVAGGLGATRQPGMRACAPGSGSGAFYVHNGTARYSSSGYTEGGTLIFRLAYVSGAGWRLYYRFGFDLSGATVGIVNPSSQSIPVVATGTVNIGGYDLDWEAGEVPAQWVLTGAGLSATFDEWSF